MVWPDASRKVRAQGFEPMNTAKPRKSAQMTKPSAEQTAKLRSMGLRPTRQRLALASLLFGAHDRHVSAEELHEEAGAIGIKVSLATVYNTLHQFTEAGLLRELSVDGARTYFDTNLGDHHHFYCEEDGELTDIEGGSIAVAGVPQPPDGAKLKRVDVIVRVSRAPKARH
jgi:Fur family iron response transcriptional regulator